VLIEKNKNVKQLKNAVNKKQKNNYSSALKFTYSAKVVTQIR